MQAVSTFPWGRRRAESSSRKRSSRGSFQPFYRRPMFVPHAGTPTVGCGKILRFEPAAGAARPATHSTCMHGTDACAASITDRSYSAPKRAPQSKLGPRVYSPPSSITNPARARCVVRARPRLRDGLSSPHRGKCAIVDALIHQLHHGCLCTKRGQAISVPTRIVASSSGTAHCIRCRPPHLPQYWCKQGLRPREFPSVVYRH